MVSEFTGYVKDKKLPVGRNTSSIEAYASTEDNGQLEPHHSHHSLLPSSVVVESRLVGLSLVMELLRLGLALWSLERSGWQPQQLGEGLL